MSIAIMVIGTLALFWVLIMLTGIAATWIRYTDARTATERARSSSKGWRGYRRERDAQPDEPTKTERVL